MSKKREKKLATKQANQYTIDPRQAMFLNNYLNPKSVTFSNAYQSAIAVGYEDTYAKIITSQAPDWLSEKLRDNNMVNKAEKNLDNMLELDTFEPVLLSNGEPLMDEAGNLLKRNNARLLNIKADISKFVSERLNKKKYGKDESPIRNTVIAQIVFNKNVYETPTKTIENEA